MNEASPGSSVFVVRLGTVSKRFMPLIFLCLVLTAVDLHFVATKVGGTGFSLSVEASEGVVNGMPHWRLYQSRVLGPYTVDLISRSFAISYLAAQAFYGAVLLLLAKLVIVLHRRHDQSSGPTVFMLLMVVFSSRFWSAGRGSMRGISSVYSPSPCLLYLSSKKDPGPGLCRWPWLHF